MPDSRDPAAPAPDASTPRGSAPVPGPRPREPDAPDLPSDDEDPGAALDDPDLRDALRGEREHSRRVIAPRPPAQTPAGPDSAATARPGSTPSPAGGRGLG